MPDRPTRDSLSSERPIPRRPRLFRALGDDAPPPVIRIDGIDYRLQAELKHDSWAATAVYQAAGGARVACKFNRISPLPGGLPAAWLGNRLARREAAVLRLMAGIPGFPVWSGPVSVGGREWPHAVAHDWIDGRPFAPSSDLDDGFFPELDTMLAALHARDIAYVDMSKWGNILVGDDGRPHLIDYQIHFRLPRGLPLRWLLRIGQRADLYYFRRHWLRSRPDQIDPARRAAWSRQPTAVWIAESLGPAFRGLRLRILRWHGVRPARPPD